MGGCGVDVESEGVGCVEGRGEVVAVAGVEDVPCCLGAEILCG